MEGSGCFCLRCGTPGAPAPGSSAWKAGPREGKVGSREKSSQRAKLLSAVDSLQVSRPSCHLLVPRSRRLRQSGRQKSKGQWWVSGTACNWFRYTVAPRCPAPTETQGPPSAQGQWESTQRSRRPCTAPRQSVTDIPARKLQLPAGPAPAARPRPARPRPPPPGLRTGRGGGRDGGGGRGASGGRDPARRVKPRWRLVGDPDADGRGVSHDRRISPSVSRRLRERGSDTEKVSAAAAAALF